MTITFHLITHRADHLTVADIAALADIDIAAGQFQGRIGAHALDGFDGVLQIEQRHDLHQAADQHDQKA
jgi:hypothetical protein